VTNDVKAYMSNAKRSQLGVTLMELMIIVAIIGTLAAVAYPSYQSAAMRSHRTSGQECLNRVQQRMEGFSIRFNSYSTDLAALGFTDVSSGSIPCSDTDRYRVSISAPTTACPITRCYQLLASPNTAQVKDGALRLIHDPSAANINNRLLRQRHYGGAWQEGWQ
jgi:type IV pilus assembly protein PilE